MMNQIQDKRNKTLQPIYDELNAAIKAVAEENGFQMIFDQSVLLYSDEAADVSALVKTKLGI
jgi:outer membrane protein